MEEEVVIKEYTVYAVVDGLEMLGNGSKTPHIFWRREDAQAWIDFVETTIADASLHKGLINWTVKEINISYT